MIEMSHNIKTFVNSRASVILSFIKKSDDNLKD